MRDRLDQRLLSLDALMVLSIVALACGSTFNALPNGFTYDDRFVVLANPAVRRILGWEQFFLLPYWPLPQGGDGYRPLTILLFALEWAASHSFVIFHAASMLLYAACAVAVLWFARLLVSSSVAWLAAAFFAVHPLHVEATANTVGQSELVAGLLIIVATGLFIQGRRRGVMTVSRQAAIATSFFIACLFKEHAVVIPALIVLGEMVVVPGGASIRQRLRENASLALMILIASLVYFTLRAMVIPSGLIGFAPYTPFATLHLGPLDRAVTMLGIIPQWIRLLVWPSRLSAEYGPPAYAVDGRWTGAAFVGIACIVATAATLAKTKRASPSIAFAIGWIAILLLPVSNVVVASGVLLAERTLFAASMGACLLGAMAVSAVMERLRQYGSLGRVASLVLPGAFMITGLARSIVRQADWRDNETLFKAAVSAEPRVYRGHYMLGAWYLETGRWSMARTEMETAMSLFDGDPAVAYNLGLGYLEAGDLPRALGLFERVEAMAPGALDAKAKMALVLAASGNLVRASTVATEALQYARSDAAAMRAIVQAAALKARSERRVSR